MKKNIFMRLACVVLVLTLLSTCVISGTFAKYVTSDDVDDTARVAKFGVEVLANGTLFDTTYLTTTNTPGGTTEDGVDGLALSVESSNSDKLVAPGTKNTDGMTFSIKGTPEVDVKVEVTVADTFDEIFLGKGVYTNVTTGDATDVSTIAADYYPVKFTLTQTKVGGTATDLVTAGTLAEVKTALLALNDTHVDANTDLGAEVYGDFKLTWEWAFDGDDEADTILGDLAAATPSVLKYADGVTAITGETTGTAPVDNTGYELDTNLDFTITVTQID